MSYFKLPTTNPKTDRKFKDERTLADNFKPNKYV